jgi:hypothetical protein
VKLLTQGIALAVVGAGLFAVPSQLAQAAPTVAKADSGIQAMKNEAQGTVAVSDESANGKIGFIAVRGQGDLLPTADADSAGSAATKARAYLDKYATSFGARPGELQQSSIARSAESWTISYTQEYQGVPVFGSLLKANVDKQGDLTAVNGFAAPDLSLSTTPGLSAGKAAERAVGTVRQDPPGHDGDADTTGIKAVSTDLMVYRMGSTKGEDGKAVLAWVSEVSNEKNVRDMVFLDASTGKLLNRYSLVHDALDRQLYEASGTPQAPKYTLVWEEGDPFPGTLNEDQAN